MEKIKLAHKYKLQVPLSEIGRLSRWAGSCRFLKNLALEERNLLWSQWKKSTSYLKQANQLPELKKMIGNEWLSDVPSQCLQEALKDLDKAFTNFFEHGFDYPTFKKKGFKDSIRFPDKKTIIVKKLNRKWASVELPKGLKLKFRLSRSLQGEIRSATIIRESDGWYISFALQVEADKPTNSADSEIGIDRGITDSMVCSNGEVFNLPIKAKTKRDRVSVLQKRLRKKKKFSKNWHKDQSKIRKLNSQIANIRKDFLHKTSTHLAKNHGLIVLEDLKIKNMSKSAKGTTEEPGKNVKAKSGLNREILFQGWGMFASMLNYKTQWYGSRLELVDPKNTSRTCPSCGVIDKDNRDGKKFKCTGCGFEADADLVGSINIKNKFTAGRAGSACGGADVSPAVEARTSGKRRRKSA